MLQERRVSTDIPVRVVHGKMGNVGVLVGRSRLGENFGESSVVSISHRQSREIPFGGVGNVTRIGMELLMLMLMRQRVMHLVMGKLVRKEMMDLLRIRQRRLLIKVVPRERIAVDDRARARLEVRCLRLQGEGRGCRSDGVIGDGIAENHRIGSIAST